MITEQHQLEAVCRQARQSPFCTVDTEFFWQRTYFPAISLIQIATPETVAVIDAVALPQLEPVADLLADASVLKVFHSADQDIPLLRRITGACTAPLFDTQIGASLAGGPQQVSYADLVHEFLGISLDKQHQFSDWLQRPLPADNLAYAADDVRHLATIYPLLAERLKDGGRLGWAEEDSARRATELCQLPDTPEEPYRNIRGFGRLKRRELARLQALASWREAHALEVDRRPRKIVPDHVLLNVAQSGQVSEALIAREYNSVARRIRRVFPHLTEVICQVEETPENDLPAIAKRRPMHRAEKAAVATAMEMLEEKGRSLGIEPCVLATRAEITSLVRYIWDHQSPPADSALLTTWRHDAFGAELIGMLTQRLG